MYRYTGSEELEMENEETRTNGMARTAPAAVCNGSRWRMTAGGLATA